MDRRGNGPRPEDYLENGRQFPVHLPHTPRSVDVLGRGLFPLMVMAPLLTEIWQFLGTDIIGRAEHRQDLSV